MFDLAAFIVQSGIDYIDRGANVMRGAINIRCPFCGDDPSYHMGISLRNGYWGCWRNMERHVGRRPHRLLMALLNCSYADAARLVGDSAHYGTDIDKVLKGLTETEEIDADKPQRRLKMPTRFRTIDRDDGIYGDRFWQYLKYERGFRSGLSHVVKEYDLRYATTGYYRWRVIIPVYVQGRLTTWTGRSVKPAEELRYLSQPEDETSKLAQEYGPALSSIKATVLHYDRLMEEGGKVLVVVEGPFDAIKLDYYGREFGVRATCVFSTSSTNEWQKALLYDLSYRFDRMLLLFDINAEVQEMSTAMRLEPIKCDRLPVKPFEKDPGEMEADDIAAFAQNLARGRSRH